MDKQPTFKNQHVNIVEKIQTLGYEQCSMQSYETCVKLYNNAFNMYWQMTIIKILIKIPCPLLVCIVQDVIQNCHYQKTQFNY
jgi:hypothetical protein